MVKIYVEGGGDAALLKTECRQGFSRFFEAAGFKGKMPRVVACGSRNDAFKSFCTAINQGEFAFLLVDSEDAIDETCQEGNPEQWTPWEHLGKRDNWIKPNSAADLDCHLMVQCMEAWFLADRKTLQDFFGQGFNAKALLSAENAIESVAKKQIYRSLSDATQNCKTKARYGKGEHSFKLLGRIVPDRVTAASPWAKRFIDVLKVKLSS